MFMFFDKINCIRRRLSAVPATAFCCRPEQAEQAATVFYCCSCCLHCRAVRSRESPDF
ncbi:hypothetical protein [Methanimicrococcus hongohii]|uniref:hypothetical protein n=1 Tax=Methanimicrococcus hongohii TaxID=3028295 RepID=UPI00292CC338|nr:hypothetical protein [Methanimicrococcus sp. Hf6]